MINLELAPYEKKNKVKMASWANTEEERAGSARGRKKERKAQ